jgi:hypothetical protein
MLDFFKIKNYKIKYKPHWNGGEYFDIKKFEIFKKVLERQIKKIMSNDIFSHKIEDIEIIVFSSYSNLFSMQVNIDRINFKHTTVEVNAYMFIKRLIEIEGEFDEKILERNIFEALTHEFVHIKHKLISGEILKSYYLNTHRSKLNDYKLSNSKNFKEVISNLQKLFFTEGIASFYQKERDYTIQDFEELYLKDYSKIERIVNKINSIKVFNSNRVDEFYENRELVKVPYEVGCLMTYSILLANEEFNFDNMISLSEIKFYKLYEKSVGILNKKYSKKFKVLVSYNSGKGIYDYNRYLNLIYRNDEIVIKNKNEFRI